MSTENWNNAQEYLLLFPICPIKEVQILKTELLHKIPQYSISWKWLYLSKLITCIWKDTDFNWHSIASRMYQDGPKSHIFTCDPLFLHHRVVSLERVDILFVGFTFHRKLQATWINPSHLFVLFLDRTLNGVQYSPHPFHTQFLWRTQQYNVNADYRGANNTILW